jgi:ABC-type nitrate/sulfonate/bicarbonate transport system ATPase subunit
VKIENLTVRYGENVVLNGINLDVLDGEITCVLGSSGVGKTSLLKAVSKLIKYEGFIEDKSVSFVFQSPALIDGITLFQNLKLVCNDEEKIEKGLIDFSLLDKKDCYPKTLSGGEKQRVNLLRAFLSSGEVTLLDEPFSSLDIKTKISIINYFISAWQKDKKATLFVTHDIDEALAVAGRIIILKDGVVALDMKIDSDYPREYFGDSDKRKMLLSHLI